MKINVWDDTCSAYDFTVYEAGRNKNKFDTPVMCINADAQNESEQIKRNVGPGQFLFCVQRTVMAAAGQPECRETSESKQSLTLASDEPLL